MAGDSVLHLFSADGGYDLWREEQEITSVCGGLGKCDEISGLLVIFFTI